MAKPAPHERPINSSSSGWVSRLNENFEECLDEPFALAEFADVGTLTTEHPPGLFKDCLALIGGVVYSSDGTTWGRNRAQLAFIDDLDTGTATITDVKDAYNGLLADMQTKGWMV